MLISKSCWCRHCIHSQPFSFSIFVFIFRWVVHCKWVSYNRARFSWFNFCITVSLPDVMPHNLPQYVLQQIASLPLGTILSARFYYACCDAECACKTLRDNQAKGRLNRRGLCVDRKTTIFREDHRLFHNVRTNRFISTRLKMAVIRRFGKRVNYSQEYH